MATIGSVLTIPESGWIRIDDNSENIQYNGAYMYTSSHAQSYNQTNHYIPSGTSVSDVKTSYIRFSFKGTKIRLIAPMTSEYTSQLSISIDGIESICSCYKSTSIYQCLIFENINLDNKIHHVEIYSKDGVRFGIDAVDIDEGGEILVYGTEEQENVSHKNASLTYTIPMNTTEKILAKTNDLRVGLLGMANDAENYGDLYVVGGDGKSHLTRSGIKSEVIFDGSAGTPKTGYTLSKSIDNFSHVIVTGMCEEVGSVIYSIELIISKENYNYISKSSTHAICGVSYANDASGYTIGFRFEDDKTLYINSITKTITSWENVRISKVIGVY